jgi:hypothetical protein
VKNSHRGVSPRIAAAAAVSIDAPIAARGCFVAADKLVWVETGGGWRNDHENALRGIMPWLVMFLE